MMCVSCDKSAWRNAVLSNKPMGKVCSHCIKRITEIYLNQAPPQRTWVGLTEEDFSAINQSCLTKLQAAISAESILKEKNT